MILELALLFLLSGRALASLESDEWVSTYNSLFKQPPVGALDLSDVASKLQKLADVDQPEGSVDHNLRAMMDQVTMVQSTCNITKHCDSEALVSQFDKTQRILSTQGDSVILSYLRAMRTRQFRICEENLGREIVLRGQRLETSTRTEMRALQHSINKLQPNISNSRLKLNTLVAAVTHLMADKRLNTSRRSLVRAFEESVLQPCNRVLVKLARKVNDYKSLRAELEAKSKGSPAVSTYVNYVELCQAMEHMKMEIEEEVYREMERHSKGRLRLLKPRFTGLFGN